MRRLSCRDTLGGCAAGKALWKEGFCAAMRNVSTEDTHGHEEA
jgi:hypothetical protein